MSSFAFSALWILANFKPAIRCFFVVSLSMVCCLRTSRPAAVCFCRAFCRAVRLGANDRQRLVVGVGGVRRGGGGGVSVLVGGAGVSAFARGVSFRFASPFFLISSLPLPMRFAAGTDFATAGHDAHIELNWCTVTTDAMPLAASFKTNSLSLFLSVPSNGCLVAASFRISRQSRVGSRNPEIIEVGLSPKDTASSRAYGLSLSSVSHHTLTCVSETCPAMAFRSNADAPTTSRNQWEPSRVLVLLTTTVLGES